MLGSEVTVAAAGMPLLRCAWRDSVAVWTMAPTLPEILVIPDAQADPRCAPAACTKACIGLGSDRCLGQCACWLCSIQCQLACILHCSCTCECVLPGAGASLCGLMFAGLGCSMSSWSRWSSARLRALLLMP